jgi:hypothetical protein
MMKKEPYILTFSGVEFTLRDKSTGTFRLKDIARSLSMQCRYTGHVKQFYSVAEHSVLMSRYADHPDIRAVALFHDAVEAYVGDLVSPLKRLLPLYKEIEDDIERRLFKWLGINTEPYIKQLVKVLDIRMVLTERNMLLNGTAPRWPEDEVATPLDVGIKCWSPAEAEKEFMKQVESLNMAEVMI